MVTKIINPHGLTASEARRLQERHGKNELAQAKKESFFAKALKIICEPMFLLLIMAATIYFILGEPQDGAVMLVFVAGIISIEIIQEWKTDRTLNALKELSAPRCTVIRDGIEVEIASVDLVPGDIMLIHEGVKIPADGFIIKCSDLYVDESSLTGESEGVEKVASEGVESVPPEGAHNVHLDFEKQSSGYWRKDYCYAGTLVTQGSAMVQVDNIGAMTEYGKIGANVASAPDSPTPLQKQTRTLVMACGGIAAVLFVSVGAATYFNIPDQAFGDRITGSILSGITIAMAMIPEEFPVILIVFLSMGAWRLAKKNSLVRKLPSVETLGAVSVLCVDKTGTITMNQMAVQDAWAVDGNTDLLCEVMGLACETETYDPMEKAMLAYCETLGISKEHLFSGFMITEYSFSNELKMMGHVWRHDGEIIIAAKGSPEKILALCSLNERERGRIEEKAAEMSRNGLRVIAVATAKPENEAAVPKRLIDCRLSFQGLIGLTDPPRENVREDIAACVKAGIRIVMITGDNGLTAKNIAQRAGIPGSDKVITGDELNAMADEELRTRVKSTNIFSRVIPEHKMRIVKALKDNGEIVAMTGDGVNDAPALKYADIGIAMGKRGSEVAREAADLILMDDNFSTIVDTIKDGRRIYANIRKAVGYVVTIHIPIALAALLAPVLGINPSDLFLLPLHVVLLELVIDPTCSIVFERQPAELDVMDHPPRSQQENILGATTLLKSMVQGLVIFAASFGTYYYLITQHADNSTLARTMGLVIIIFANLFLVQVNSSDTGFAVTAAKQLVKDKVVLIANIGTIVGLLLILYTPLSGFLKLTPLSPGQFFTAFLTAAASVVWYEAIKAIKNTFKTGTIRTAP